MLRKGLEEQFQDFKITKPEFTHVVRFSSEGRPQEGTRKLAKGIHKFSTAI
jgi:hypothetical protein